MQTKIQHGDKPSKTYDYATQNTIRNLLIQEKEFLYNLWSILNPLQKNQIENALVYDVLLLLIYNVKAPISTTAGFLREYLENLYREESIDFEQYSNYNTGTSQKSQFIEEQTSLNKYLTYNNIWSVERIAAEFKTIHANRVSNNQYARSRSPSPHQQ